MEGIGTERAMAFSDGVFAIAITLLVLTIEIPDLGTETNAQLDRALDDVAPALLSYFIGFYVIGKFWLGHHQLFARLRGVDTGLLNANLLYLAIIALLPFPTGVLGEHAGLTSGVAIFAAIVAVAGLCETLLMLLAQRKGLLRPESKAERRAYLYEALTVPVIFGLSVPIAFAHPDVAKLFWLSLIVLRAGGARLGLMPSPTR